MLLVHRPRYDDWSLPKGKLDPGESWQEAAIREVEEETGVVGTLGREVATLVHAEQAASRYEVTFDARGLAAGVYVYRLTAGGEVLTGRMTLVK